ncbi:hypothetical protein F4819DRAFT_444080 [Hypoxylon fuscum]|nr:hypothetical protein F4819DRAFT_444080 [Hypoxylon fuscum]
MNRLCQSSYGSLEAVINFANPERKLVHFYRDRLTGKWHSADIISNEPLSGGSIIQNAVKRHNNQEHGDFEVLVLEAGGLVKHYTRDNTLPVDSGEYAWQPPVIVNVKLDPKDDQEDNQEASACSAAPLHQSSIPAGDSLIGSTLETALLTKTGDVMHYRCPQRKGDSNDISHKWELAGRIIQGATGPTCLFQGPKGDLRALVPIPKNVVELSFTDGVWKEMARTGNTYGPACTWTPSPADEPMCAILCIDDEFTMLGWLKSKGCFCFNINMQGSYNPSPLAPSLPSALRRLALSPHYRAYPGNPISIVSQSLNVLGHSPNAEAIVFHPCGSGWQDSWMILQWSHLTTTKEWIVSDVVMAEVRGVPM